MKIEDLLNDSWKDIINKNFKWLAAVMIRYASVSAMVIVLFLFIFLNYFASSCGRGESGNNSIFVIKQGKTINITKIGKENNIEHVKDIDSLIKELEDLKEK